MTGTEALHPISDVCISAKLLFRRYAQRARPQWLLLLACCLTLWPSNYSSAVPPLASEFEQNSLPAPLPSSSLESISTNAQLPAVPTAIPWPSGEAASGIGGTHNSSLLPQSGLVIPNDGSLPFPAAGVTQSAPEVLQPTAVPQVIASTQPLAAKQLRITGRSSRYPSIRFQKRPERGDTVATITGGVLLSIRGVQLQQADGTLVDFGTVTIETDSAVMWVPGEGEPDFLGEIQSLAERPIELYLEGNIVFRQGQRVIYADRMYYNVANEYGTVLAAEVLTPVPQYQGLLRFKADVIEQRSPQHFLAYGAAITSSRLGVPRYWLQGDRVEFRDQRAESDVATLAPTVAGRPTNMFAKSRNNFVYLGGMPVAYWPIFSTNLAKPNFYLTGLKYKNDSIFGQQVLADFDLFQILGIEGFEGTDWTLSTDYLSKRGPAIGSRINTTSPSLLFLGPTTGFSDLWVIDEQGLDFLGTDRQNLTPEETFRGRGLSRARSFINPNTELHLETSWISDRNFLEQYFENEWDQEKDLSTAARFRHYNGNRMLDIMGQGRFNDFFTETEWLPRFDHYWLGQDVFNSPVNFSAHTSVGYAHQRVATTPLDPQDSAKFALRQWETDSEGLRAATRQELNLPFDVGPWKFAPFLSGEAAYWHDDVNGDELTRLTGQGGVRSALPFWRVFPNIENRLFDIRGIAHKVTLESELFYADSDQDLSRLPLYDPVDDNSQEHFRRRFVFNTFAGALPAQFDERSFALRNGMQRWVTAGSTEVLDDTTQVRFGINQRWQTKRGLPGRERIVDLVALDVDWVVFPKPNEDNFGEELGAINYDFRYNFGDRLTFLSDGYFDVFSQGLKAISAGAMVSRPGRGNAYIGLLSLEGPISSNVLNGYVNYSMNDKWNLSGAAIFDFGEVGNVGQSLTLTRVGESALISLSVNVDSGRDNVSFNFNIEPRFLPIRRAGAVSREFIRPIGLFGVE